MGNKNNYTNWTNGCEQPCQEEVITVGCGCEAANDCGCAAPAETTCGKCGKKGGHHGGCGCNHTDGTHIWFETCDGYKEIDVTTTCQQAENWGRVLDVNMTLRNVCPGRRSAVGVHLWELDEHGGEYARGFRSFTVPAHNAGRSRDVHLPSMRFILPEDVSVAGHGGRRHFVVRTTNHYLEDPAIGSNCPVGLNG